MKPCENCGIEHDQTFSQRFCSKKCRYAFPTKLKRKEISEKVSKTLLSKDRPVKPLLEKICEFCSRTYIASKLYQKCCSLSCSAKLKRTDPAYREKMSKICTAIALKRHREGDPGITWKSRVKRGASYPEIVTMQYLDKMKLTYSREYPVHRYNIDFAFVEEKVALEIDGRQHEELANIEHDRVRDDLLRSEGWKVIRIKWQNDKKHWDRVSVDLTI